MRGNLTSRRVYLHAGQSRIHPQERVYLPNREHELQHKMEGTLATIATIHGAPKVMILLGLRKIFTILNAFNMAKLS
jgi:hypothetical protein